MSKITKYVGLDVHKDSISIAVAEEGRAEPRFLRRIAGCNARVLRVLRTLGALRWPLPSPRNNHHFGALGRFRQLLPLEPRSGGYCAGSVMATPTRWVSNRHPDRVVEDAGVRKVPAEAERPAQPVGWKPRACVFTNSSG